MKRPGGRIRSCPGTEEYKEVIAMINMSNKKTRKIVSAVIVILLVIAMVVPLVLSAVSF